MATTTLTFEQRRAAFEAKDTPTREVPWIEGYLCLLTVYVAAPAVLVCASPGWPTRSQALLSLAVWWVQMVGVNCGYHRLFSHGSYKAHPAVELCLALMGCLSGQGGPIWWAGVHRHHHRHCETAQDFHSPHNGQSTLKGLVWAHGLFLANYTWPDADKSANCPDLTSKRWLAVVDDMAALVFFAWAALCYLAPGGGLLRLLYGWAIPTFCSWNCEQCINSVLHMYGDRPFTVLEGDGECEARNNRWLTLAMLGENWHNNHHAFPWSARQGYGWAQLDLNFCVIWALSKAGLAWDVRSPSAEERALRLRQPQPRPQGAKKAE